MIIQEYYATRRDGVELIRTVSDCGLKIARNGDMYDEAIDVAGNASGYIETDYKITEPDDAQYAEAGKILLGVRE